MKDNFEIKYKIIPSHLNEMRTLNLEEFNQEFTSIYGNFRMIFQENIFIDSMVDNATDEVSELFSELVSDYLDGLIGIFENIESYSVIHLKYFENSVSWLKFVNNDKEIIVYETKIEYNPIMNRYLTAGGLITKSRLFKEEEIKWGPVLIDKKRFKERILDIVESLIYEMKEINPVLLQGNCLKRIYNFNKRHSTF